MSGPNAPRRVLLTGATGYIGGRLLGRLEEAGHRVRCLARRPAFLAPRVGPDTEVVGGDVLRPESLPPALADVDVAYYLVHSMGDRGEFHEKEIRAARHFAAAARASGVGRVVYLGGLGSGDDLSTHLRSRQDVGRILRESGVPTIEFRSSIIVGSGSLSFELIRAIVDKLPVMITPTWVRTPTDPIAVEDVLEYLLAAIDHPLEESTVYEIAGPDRMSYGDLMLEYAKQRGLRRWMVPVPFLSPRLSSLWLGLVTPVYARIGRKLLTSVKNATVVEDHAARAAFPVQPRGMEEAIARALNNEDREIAETRWSDALSSGRGVKSWAGVRFGSRLVDSRTRRVRVSPEQAFRPIERIGGARGWYFANWLWRIRGFLDLVFGGVGMRRGRRDPDTLRAGDQLDFWRVAEVTRPRSLRLFAEMRLPGRAWLRFEVEDPGGPGDGGGDGDGDGTSERGPSGPHAGEPPAVHGDGDGTSERGPSGPHAGEPPAVHGDGDGTSERGPSGPHAGEPPAVHGDGDGTSERGPSGPHAGEPPAVHRGAVIRQTAVFDPVGLFGLLYWYGIYPLHALVFRGMLRNIARRAEREANDGG